VLFTFVTGSVLLVPGKACAVLLAFLRPYILDAAHKQLTEASTQLAVVQSLIAKGAEGAGAVESSELAAAQQQLSDGMEVVRSAGLDKATVTAKFEQAK
jgi:hypothetical protein